MPVLITVSTDEVGMSLGPEERASARRDEPEARAPRVGAGAPPGAPRPGSLGSRRQLLPHPGIEQSAAVLLVEGEPNMIAARSRGLPAIALPGVDSWKDDWAAMLAGRQISIAMDCDRRGRAGAQRIEQALGEFAVVRIVDLEPTRHDGYDLTNWILDGSPNAETIDLGGPTNARSDGGG